MDSDSYKQEQPLVTPYANRLEDKSDEIQKSPMSMQKKWIYYIEACGREVAQMLAQGHR